MDYTLIPINSINIEKSPDVTTGYDFTVEDFFTFCTDDGVFVQDSMTVIHPLSDKSQKEISEKMMNVKSATGLTNTITELSKDMYIGLYIITKSKKKNNRPLPISNEELEKVNDPYMMVSYRNKICTAGFAIFNSCFPKDFPFQNKIADKSTIKKLITKAIGMYDQEVFRKIMDNLAKVGFKWATIAGSSFTLANLEVPKEIFKLKKQMDGADPEETTRLLDEAEKVIKKFLHDTGLGDIIESGSAKGYDQAMQISVAKGLISDLDGNILPGIGTSFSDMLPPDVFFQAGQGSRVGIAGRVLDTADTGYLARKLVYFMNGVELHPSLNDCGTKRTIEVNVVDSGHLAKLQYRYVVKNGKTIPIEDADVKVGDSIHLRTPIYCTSEKICHVCHGTSYKRKPTPYIGAMYALMLGESATQASMVKFHTGGAVRIKKKNILTDLIHNAPFLKKDILSKYLIKSGNDLVCKEDCKLIVDVEDLKMSDDGDYYYNDETKKIVLKTIVSNLFFRSIKIPILLDYVIQIDVTKVTKQTKEELIFGFNKGDTILYTTLEDNSMTALSRYLDRLIGGRIKFYNTEHLLSIVFQQYKSLSSLPMVVVEVLISQILRYKDDPKFPARLGKEWKPELMNLRKSVYNEGFIQGLAFENINEAIKNGLLQNTGDNLNILEKVFVGEKL